MAVAKGCCLFLIFLYYFLLLSTSSFYRYICLYLLHCMWIEDAFAFTLGFNVVTFESGLADVITTPDAKGAQQ